MIRIFIFAYGSLINLQSASRTLTRQISPIEVVRVNLKGYGRVWNYSTRVYACDLERTVNAVYLNLEQKNSHTVNGIAFEVTKDELEKLKVREKYYDLVDVTSNSDVIFDGKLFAFICSDPKHIADKGDSFFVMKKYVGMVEEGCRGFGERFFKDFESSTSVITYPIISGEYEFR